MVFRKTADKPNIRKYKEEKVFIAARVLLSFLLFPVAGIAGFFAGDEKVCGVEIREYPGRDPMMWDDLYAACDGKVYSALISEGQSAHFIK